MHSINFYNFEERKDYKQGIEGSGRIARNEVEKTVLGRTAECSAIYHQPKRPKKREN